jgi:hypothetical protein
MVHVDLLLHLIVFSKESIPLSWMDLLLDSFMSTYGGHTMEVSHLWGLWRSLEHLSKSIDYSWRLLHFCAIFGGCCITNSIILFIVDLSHGVGYMRALLYCFP